jgi:putative nucleotidyltransferase with HDIG domain
MKFAPPKLILHRYSERSLELTLVACVILSAFLIQVLVPHKLIVMNFFYLPTVVASYFIGTRVGGLTAFLSFLIIGAYALADPARFLIEGPPQLLALDLLIWGAFLGLTAVVVGNLCDRLHQRMREVKAAYVGVLEILTKFLETADHYTKSHSVRVAEMSVAIAAKMSLSDEEIENVRAGALLHDIGKTESIDLVKRAASLNETERRQVDNHTITGAEMVQSVGMVLQEAVPIILYHHHYYGGKPGQEGPVGDQIPLGARIVAVADAYDAMITDRPYRKGRAPWQALAEIQACAGKQFDPDVVETFKTILPSDSEEPERESAALVYSASEAHNNI